MQLESSDQEFSHKLRVMSFNVLAKEFARGAPEEATHVAPEDRAAAPPPDGLALVERNWSSSSSSSSHPGRVVDAQKVPFRCPQSCLEWRYRWPKIRETILAQNADLIALQELDLAPDDSTWPEVLQAFESVGYHGRSAKKLQFASDGVALFWRAARLRPVGKPEVWRLHQKSVHIALSQLLVLDGKVMFRAVTTHLKAGITHAEEYERYEQIKALARQLSSAEPRVPTLILADLNSHCRRLNGKDGVTVEPLVYDFLTSQGFRSLCKEINLSREEMQFTCWGGWQGYDVAGVFDYVLGYEEHLEHQAQIIRPMRLLGCPQAADVRKFSERLPNKDHPSDHIPVVVDLIMRSIGAAYLDNRLDDLDTAEEAVLLELAPEVPEAKETVEVPKQVLGRVIGSGGKVIKAIRDKSGVAKVDVVDQSSDPCQVVLEGREVEIARAKQMIEEIKSANEIPASTDATSEHAGNGAHARLDKPPGQFHSGSGRPHNFKTVLCNNFERGHCYRGASCNFAHGQDDLKVAFAPPEQHTNVFVCKLPASVGEADFSMIMGCYGHITRLHLEAGKGYGFVKYSNLQEAESAIASLNGLEYSGARLEVRFARQS